MAQGFADSLEDDILDLFTGNAIAAWTSLTIGLFTTIPGDTGSGGSPSDGVEASGTAYARVTITGGALATWLGAKSTSGTVRHRVSAADTVFPTAGSGGWGSIVGYGVWDNNGKLRAYGTITPLTVTAGMTPKLLAGVIDIGVD